MNYRLFAGIDVSKLKIDVVFFLAENPDNEFHELFENTDEGCSKMIAWINSLTGLLISDMLFCAEIPGFIHFPSAHFLMIRAETYGWRMH